MKSEVRFLQHCFQSFYAGNLINSYFVIFLEPPLFRNQSKNVFVNTRYKCNTEMILHVGGHTVIPLFQDD